MYSMRNVFAGFPVLVVLTMGPAPADETFCNNVANDWGTMKSHIELLKSESEAVGQPNTDVQALTTRLANLEAQVAQCSCGGTDNGGQPDATSGTTTPVATVAPYTGSVPNTGNYNLSEVLHKSILFYEAQRSGDLPATNRIPWRLDSALGDKGNNNEDLTGGWYDAGDYVKFGLPMAYSVTMLAWGMIEYRDAYSAAGELAYGLDCIKWPLDYFIKAHVADNKFYGQENEVEIGCKKVTKITDEIGCKKVINLTYEIGCKKVINLTDEIGCKKVINLTDEIGCKKVINLTDEIGCKKVINLTDEIGRKKVINLTVEIGCKKVINLTDEIGYKQVVNLTDEINVRTKYMPST
ncbi:hypothetical protein LSAT2_003807 [Lamellibrachia satsuma]|nr:hypothetical protein LSAT2_003807 [Lamellibrachia satsuma]